MQRRQYGQSQDCLEHLPSQKFLSQVNRGCATGSVEITGPLPPLLIKIHFSQFTSSLSGKSSLIWLSRVSLRAKEALKIISAVSIMQSVSLSRTNSCV